MRITPAHAGKSESPLHLSAKSQDHPRACGEKLDNPDYIGAYAGSPPRMRGKAVLPSRSCGQVGITPAHAGKRLKDP